MQAEEDKCGFAVADLQNWTRAKDEKLGWTRGGLTHSNGLMKVMG